MTDAQQRNPYRGRPGLGNRINAFLFPYIGQAQVGDGGGSGEPRPERPAARCPSCARPYAEHAMHRGGPGATSRLVCPEG